MNSWTEMNVHSVLYVVKFLQAIFKYKISAQAFN
jgi:hypothetical protein